MRVEFNTLSTLSIHLTDVSLARMALRLWPWRFVVLLGQRRFSFEATTSFHRIHNTHTYPFYGPFSGTTRVSRYQKGKTNPDFTEARDSEWQWHQLGHMQVCITLQTDNRASTPPLSFLQAGCPSCRPTSSVKALTANSQY